MGRVVSVTWNPCAYPVMVIGARLCITQTNMLDMKGRHKCGSTYLRGGLVIARMPYCP